MEWLRSHIAIYDVVAAVVYLGWYHATHTHTYTRHMNGEGGVLCCFVGRGLFVVVDFCGWCLFCGGGETVRKEKGCILDTSSSVLTQIAGTKG